MAHSHGPDSWMAPDVPGQGVPHRFRSNDQAPRPRLRRLAPYALAAVLGFAVLLTFGLGREGGAGRLLVGPDDFMRVVQVLDWLDGQSWNDVVQRRLNPPAGVDMHWSRLADLPLAAVITLAEPWLGRPGAVDLAVLVVPPLLGGVFLALFLWAAVPLIPNREAALPAAVFATPALLNPLLQMQPGRVDHHGLQLVLAALAIGFLMRCLSPGRPWAAAALGMAGGVSLAVGLESLPFLGVATVILSLVWVLRGGRAAMALTCFGTALAATSLLLLLLTLPPPAWPAIACDRLSLPHVALAVIVLAAGGAALALGRLRPAAGRSMRLAVVGGVCMAGPALAATAFPQCAGSPYASFSDEIRYWLVSVAEAQTLVDLFQRKPGDAVSAVSLPVAALVAVGWLWARSSDRAEPRWPALALLVLSGVVLTTWQFRGVYYTGLVSGLALVPLVAMVNERADGSERVVTRLGLRLCIPLLCLFAMALPPRLLPGSTRAADAEKSRCDAVPVIDALTDPAGLGAEFRTLAAPVFLGPQILFRTRHRVLAAPHHRNVEGLANNRRIFGGTEEQALATIQQVGVDTVLFCPTYAFAYPYADLPGFLDDRLDSGNPPWWLLFVAEQDGQSLYVVHPDAGQP